MTGRIYSGNLNDNRDAIARLQEDYDLKVVEVAHTVQNPQYHRIDVWVRVSVLTRSGNPVARRRFNTSLKDPDVLINEQTAWLRQVYSELRFWK